MNTTTCTRCHEVISTPVGFARWEDTLGFQSCGSSANAGAHLPA